MGILEIVVGLCAFVGLFFGLMARDEIKGLKDRIETLEKINQASGTTTTGQSK